MSWINFKENPPKKGCVALVANEKGWMNDVRATYYGLSNVWIYYTPTMETLTLEVTHYLPIPSFKDETTQEKNQINTYKKRENYEDYSFNMPININNPIIC